MVIHNKFKQQEGGKWQQIFTFLSLVNRLVIWFANGIAVVAHLLAEGPQCVCRKCFKNSSLVDLKPALAV